MFMSSNEGRECSTIMQRLRATSRGSPREEDRTDPCAGLPLSGRLRSSGKGDAIHLGGVTRAFTAVFYREEARYRRGVPGGRRHRPGRYGGRVRPVVGARRMERPEIEKPAGFEARVQAQGNKPQGSHGVVLIVIYYYEFPGTTTCVEPYSAPGYLTRRCQRSFR